MHMGARVPQLVALCFASMPSKPPVPHGRCNAWHMG
jgi:hypothetical protein